MNLQEGELRKRLEIFQDYTASWGYPMNQDAHAKGLDVAEEAIQALITTAVNEARKEGFDTVLDLLADIQTKYVIDPAAIAVMKNERHKYADALNKTDDKEGTL